MSAPLVMRWRVMVTSWQAQSVVVEAASATAAETEAERLWIEGDASLFSYKDGGLDGLFAEELLP